MSAAPQLQAVRLFEVEIVSGPHKGMTATIGKFPFKVGRNPDNDMALVNDAKASRYQVEFQVQDGKTIVQNVSQKVQMSINGQKMSGAIINGDCEIFFGESTLRIRFLPDRPALPAVQSPQLFLSPQLNMPNQAAQPSGQFQPQPQVQSKPFLEPPKLIDSPPQPDGVPTTTGLIRLAGNVPLSPGSTHQGPLPETENQWFPGNQQFHPPQLMPGQTLPPQVGFAMGIPAPGFPQPGPPLSGPPQPAGQQHPHSFFGGAAAMGEFPAEPVQKKKSGKGFFYAVIAVVILMAVWLSGTPDKKRVAIETNPIVESEKVIVDSEANIKNLKQKKKDSGQETMQYNLAQSHYLKGFRDFRNGQFGRAIPSFEAALSFYPQHELAKKYLNQSRVKLDQMIAYQMNLGRTQRSKNNYRQCAATFSATITMITDVSDTRYRESKQLLEECEFLAEEKF